MVGVSVSGKAEMSEIKRKLRSRTHPMDIKLTMRNNCNVHEKPVLAYGGQEEETDAALEDDLHRQVLQQNADDDQVEWYTEEIHDSGAC